MLSLLGCDRPSENPTLSPETAPAASQPPESPEPVHTPTASQAPPLPPQVASFEVAEEEPVKTEKPRTIRNLCEPVSDRRPFPTPEERKKARALINKTCKAMGVSHESCTYFRLVSARESSYRWWVRHKKKGDTAAAMTGYLAAAHAYGWKAHWPYQARRQEDLTQLELESTRKYPNPYYPEVDRWLTGGLGLGGLNVGYHLRKIDPNAPPEILCDPVLNVMVQVTIARNAVHRYGARNWVQVQAIYAGRIDYDKNGKAIPGKNPKRDRNMRRRCKTWGLNCNAKPQLGRKLNLNRMTPEEIYEAAEAIRGYALPPFDDPPPGPVLEKEALGG